MDNAFEHDAFQHTIEIQKRIDRWQRGDRSARDELLRGTCDRMLRITRKLLRDFGDVRRWEQTDDVYQNACVRLCRALENVELIDTRHFFRLAALQIRRELIDLARHYRGSQGAAAHHASLAGNADNNSQPPLAPDRAELSHDPRRLADWAEFHEQIELLPEEEREVFDLLWYHALSQDEAAELLGMHVRTIKRRWREARLRLQAALGEESAHLGS